MISKELLHLLEAQVGHELEASHRYLGMAVYFAHQNLDGWAEWFYRQSEEERGHALRIIRFLVDVGAEFNLPAIAEVKTQFESPLEAVQKALAWEQQVTKQFHQMAQTALAQNDFTSFQFIQWFLEEQVEEEASMEKLVSIIQSGINLFQAESLLEREE